MVDAHMSRLVVALSFLAACGPSTSTGPFKPLGSATLAESSMQDSHGIFGLVANDDHVVVGTREGQLLVFDGNQKFAATNTLETRAIGRVLLGDTRAFGSLAIRGTVLYAGLASGLLKVVSLADPTNPAVTATITIIPGTVVATTNSHFLFVSSGVRTQAIDISVSPPTVVVPELPLTSVLALVATETHLYSTDPGQTAVNAWTLGAGGQATPLSQGRLAMAPHVSALAVRGTTVLVANSGVLGLFDVSTPEAPTLLNPNPGSVAHTRDWPYGEPVQGVAVMASGQAIAPGYTPVVYELSKPEAVVGTAVGISMPSTFDLELQAYAAATRTQFWTAGHFTVHAFARD